VLTAFAAWAAVRTFRRDPPATALATLAWWMAVPGLGFGVFWATFLRGITVGGGNREGLLPPLERALAVVTGLPVGVPVAVSLVVVLAVVAYIFG
jgi:hypothetical protein